MRQINDVCAMLCVFCNTSTFVETQKHRPCVQSTNYCTTFVPNNGDQYLLLISNGNCCGGGGDGDDGSRRDDDDDDCHGPMIVPIHVTIHWHVPS
jgi:hypothetical protein